MEPTLLIVEDDAPLREVLVRALRAEAQGIGPIRFPAQHAPH